jgi:hypothetical protein
LVALSALENWLSGKAAKKEWQMLQQAEELYRDVKSAGRYFPTEHVESNDNPKSRSLESFFIVQKEFKLAAMAPKERTLAMTQCNVSFRERWSGRMERTVVGSPTVAQPCARGTLIAEGGDQTAR